VASSADKKEVDHDEFGVWRAARLPIESFQTAAQFVEHVSGYRVFATDDLLDRGEDWTSDCEPRLSEGAASEPPSC
jgi:hypothetical protein